MAIRLLIFILLVPSLSFAAWWDTPPGGAFSGTVDGADRFPYENGGTGYTITTNKMLDFFLARSEAGGRTDVELSGANITDTLSWGDRVYIAPTDNLAVLTLPAPTDDQVEIDIILTTNQSFELVPSSASYGIYRNETWALVTGGTVEVYSGQCAALRGGFLTVEPFDDDADGTKDGYVLTREDCTFTELNAQ